MKAWILPGRKESFLVCLTKLSKPVRFDSFRHYLKLFCRCIELFAVSLVVQIDVNDSLIAYNHHHKTDLLLNKLLLPHSHIYPLPNFLGDINLALQVKFVTFLCDLRIEVAQFSKAS